MTAWGIKVPPTLANAGHITLLLNSFESGAIKVHLDRFFFQDALPTTKKGLLEVLYSTGLTGWKISCGLTQWLALFPESGRKAAFS